jgi:hypothetical protein
VEPQRAEPAARDAGIPLAGRTRVQLLLGYSRGSGFDFNGAETTHDDQHLGVTASYWMRPDLAADVKLAHTDVGPRLARNGWHTRANWSGVLGLRYSPWRGLVRPYLAGGVGMFQVQDVEPLGHTTDGFDEDAIHKGDKHWLYGGNMGGGLEVFMDPRVSVAMDVHLAAVEDQDVEFRLLFGVGYLFGRGRAGDAHPSR